MKMLRASIVCGMGVCVALATGVAAASAATAELGRCTKVAGIESGKRTVYNGGYKNKNCTKVSATKTGKYEWSAGPGGEPRFEGLAIGAAVQTVSGTRIVCEKTQSFGEFTSPTAESLQLDLGGCQDAATGKQCESIEPEGGEIPTEGVIRTRKLVATLGFLPGGQKIGWDAKPATGPIFALIECGVKLTGNKTALEGSLIGQVKAANKMTEEFHMIYKQKSGKQAFEKLEGGETDVLSAKYLSGLELVTEQAAFEAGEPEEVVSYEPYEYRTKVS